MPGSGLASLASLACLASLANQPVWTANFWGNELEDDLNFFHFLKNVGHHPLSKKHGGVFQLTKIKVVFHLDSDRLV